MSDHTSAGIFRSFFQLLAENPTEENKELAKRTWNLMSVYDFSERQLGCNDSLIKLGLAEKGFDPDFPEDETIFYYEGRDKI